jgi:Aspartyl protease
LGWLRRCRVKKTVLGLLALLLSASTGLSQDLELPFEISASQSGILVRGTANGKPVLLILDTGASRTILARGLVALPRPVPPSRFSTDGPGLNARGTYTEATLELGGRLWRGRSVIAMEMEEVSRAFGQRIDGLLGQDLLREFDRITIDFRARRIVLSSGVPSSVDREAPTTRDTK